MTNYDARKQEIGIRIQRERERLHLSRKELLPKIFMSESSHKTLAAWENGDRLPDLDSLARMAELFACDIGYLLCDYNERTRVIADVCEVTGLSPKAVESLTSVDKSAISFISFLLETGLVNGIGLSASRCIDTRLEIEHYQNNVLPMTAIPPDEERLALLQFKITDSYLDAADKRGKVINKISQLRELYEARLWNCCEQYGNKAITAFIDEEVDKWLTSKNAGTKTEH